MNAHNHRESAQTLVLSIVCMTVLLGFCALVIEGGNMFVTKRNMQGVADAAAMAGVLDVTTSSSAAEADARDYATNENLPSQAVVDTIVATGDYTATCGAKSVPKYSVCVRTQRDEPSLFGSVLGGGTRRAGATAIASASQVKNMSGWLPFGVMDNQFVPGTQVSFRPGSVAPAGSINTPAGDTCKFYGGNGVRDVIASKAHGGADACPVDIGQTIETQTGVTSGNIKQGFDARIGDNTDSFDDVFEFDSAIGQYIIKKPTSPRLGIIPLAGGSGTWPLTGGASIVVSGYAFVYIGDRSSSGYPATTGSGNGLKIHLTPVNALLPASWDTTLTTWTPGANNITVYHLVA